MRGLGQVSGFAFAVLGAVCFSFKAIFVKLAYRYGVDAETLLALRMGYALPFFIAMGFSISYREPRTLSRRDLLMLLVLGVTGYYLASYLDFLGLRYVTAALERLILFIYPTLVVILSAVFLGKRVTRAMYLPMLLCYIGIALAVSHDLDLTQAGSNVALGCLLVFGSTLSYAIYLMLSGEEVKTLGATRVAAFATSVACVLSLLQFVVMRPLASLAQPWQVHALALAMALLSTVLPIWLIAVAMRRIGASATSMIGTLGPVLTILFGWAFLGESLGTIQLFGAALVIAGVVLIGRAKT
ncbi:DMT family transporter [Uliginosibacterium sp. 31-16]|uniref:DMT family transporter n=1 Tax=Uliginosibacterium sp. 31-16 TaxID=3068315 RepID=UPI00273D339B|nr:DMT family transporter [Uliginosibacterium sp. 31-16]MDP5238635.1 DMT family transporter [Uliginosibacterium sp. 31-16]